MLIPNAKFPRSPFIIGISGVAQSGKNYLTEQALIPLGFFPLAFADPFKFPLVVAGLLSPDSAWVGNKTEAERSMLQDKGEKTREEKGDDHWVKYMEVTVLSALHKGWERFALTDVRRGNEVDWVKEQGGKVVRLTGRGGLSGTTASHHTETELQDDDPRFDLVIDNSLGNEHTAFLHLQYLAYNLVNPDAQGLDLWNWV